MAKVVDAAFLALLVMVSIDHRNGHYFGQVTQK